MICSTPLPSKRTLAVKRLFDLTVAAGGCYVLIPFWLATALAIKLDSPGPALFKQSRRTIGGRLFNMYKFRSMVVDAEKQGAGIFNYLNDPRVTRVGRFLRDHSLDELPQLLNVLKGDLSLVGPRPPVSYELGDFATLNKRYKKRFTVKGGITGLAQVKGRNDISWEEKVRLDNEYVDLLAREGVWVDVKILIATLVQVLKQNNIYENKGDQTLDDEAAARQAEAEIIRLAHLPEEEDNEK